MKLNRKMNPARQRRLDSTFAPAAAAIARQLDSGSDSALRMDASSVIHLGRQLEELDTELYYVEYPESAGVNILPIKSNINAGADTYTYQSRDRVGDFAPVANWADDSPNQDVAGDSDTSKLHSFRGHYAYSVQDMRRSQMAGTGIENDRAMAARENAETKLDETLAVGYSPLNITGFFNNASVSAVTPDTGSWDLAGTDADEIVADLNKAIRTIITGSKGRVVPNAIVMAPTAFAAAETKRLANTDISALDFFRKKNPGVTISQWARAETAGAAGVRRLMVGRMDRRTLEGLVPVRFETFPPELRGLVYRVECHVRTGGCLFRYPGAWRYMDNC